MRVERASVCPLDCPDTCSLTVTVEDDRIVGIRGDGEVNISLASWMDAIADTHFGR